MEMFALLCAKGLEDIAAEELKEIGNPEISYSKGGIVFFRINNVKELVNLKTADDVMLIVKKFSGISRYRASLRNIRHQAAKANLKKALGFIREVRQAEELFFSKATYSGKRDYNADEIERAVEHGVKRHYGWKKGKSLCLRVLISDELSFMGISLDESPLYIKNRLPHTVAGSLRSSVASAMIRLARIKKGDDVIDPMCGSGVLAIESSLLGGEVIAGDIDGERIKIARENALTKNAKVDFRVWDARKTRLPKRSIDRVICNLPFEKQVPIEGNERVFLSDFLAEMLRLCRKRARLVLLTRHCDLLKEIISEQRFLQLDKIIPLQNSGINSEILCVEKVI